MRVWKCDDYVAVRLPICMQTGRGYGGCDCQREIEGYGIKDEAESVYRVRYIECNVR